MTRAARGSAIMRNMASSQVPMEYGALVYFAETLASMP